MPIGAIIQEIMTLLFQIAPSPQDASEKRFIVKRYKRGEEKMRKISIDELKIILEKHRLWLRGNGEGKRADLSYVDLSYADLRSANLSYANLSQANLSYANLSQADLKSVNLSSTSMTGVKGISRLDQIAVNTD
jgi:hypothetical protein